MKLYVLCGLVAVLTLNRIAIADDLLADRHCKRSMLGQIVCPPPNGSIAIDAAGTAVCGQGECLKDATGTWMCSIEKGGHAGRNSMGQVVCTGGCEIASPSACEIAR